MKVLTIIVVLLLTFSMCEVMKPTTLDDALDAMDVTMNK
jgi:hypothetical protein